MYPFIQLSPSLQIPTYFLFLSLLFSFLIWFTFRRAQKINLDEEKTLIAGRIGLILMIVGFVGARLTHVLYEAPNVYLAEPIRILHLWEGGYVFYGGAIAAVLAGWIYVIIKKQSFFYWADFYAPIVALGYGLGRVSCFLSGCCYGGSCEYPWAVTFPLDSIARHPVQLYVTLWELLAFFLILKLEKTLKVTQQVGLIFSLYICWHGVGRIFMESFRNDFRGAMIWGHSISTWISILIILLALSKIQKILRS